MFALLLDAEVAWAVCAAIGAIVGAWAQARRDQHDRADMLALMREMGEFSVRLAVVEAHMQGDEDE